jgi:hypothetical protein
MEMIVHYETYFQESGILALNEKKGNGKEVQREIFNLKLRFISLKKKIACRVCRVDSQNVSAIDSDLSHRSMIDY